jgi:hypothetical protein
MKTRMRTLTILTALSILGLMLPPLSPARTQEKSPEAMIQSVREVVVKPEFSEKEITKALIDALDASLLLFPRSADSEEFASRIGTVKKIFGEQSLVGDKARQYLGLAYKLASGGKAWQMPDEMKPLYREKDIMAQAKKLCAGLLDSALAERKAGRDLEAVRNLIGFVIMVVTPVEA